ncbi:MAG: SAM-dependent methyltransferase [Treponema sp.]|nr:SAM-dependent methyltransferase [Treponema sp.]
MDRVAIINRIGSNYLTANIENGEYSYQKACNEKYIDFDEIKIQDEKGRVYKNLDIRFCDDKNKFVILVETKQDYRKDAAKAKEQLSAYVSYEKELTNYTILAILANTKDNSILVWKDAISDESLLSNEIKLQKFTDYLELIKPKRKNNREEVMKHTYELNELLHEYGIKERIRGQFVGTCLLAIKNGLIYKDLPTQQVLSGIKQILESLLGNDLNKAEKLVILSKNVIEAQDVASLKKDHISIILDFIKEKIYPFINDKSTLGQDLLNLFFTTFNKYVGKADKNQAFTPDHIVDFMCKIIGINKHSRVLDPCCGSGSFLVRALTDALDDCDTKEEQEEVKKSHIYGIEYENTAFGLATTNMLIHGDGNSNVVMDSCFKRYQWIKDAHIDKVLMNPPYNAQQKHCCESYVATWKASGSKKKPTEDPSKGFHFVYEIAKQMSGGKLAVLLPMQCAIGTSSELQSFKEKILQEHHLDAVFSFPDDIFHPGASSCACCMVFDIGIKHEKAPVKETFFGYFKEDGFQKRKNLGRVEREAGIWKNKIEPLWLDLYRKRKEVAGLSVNKEVTANDEWLSEAYIKTDYSTLCNDNFQETINNYLSFLVKMGDVYES